MIDDDESLYDCGWRQGTILDAQLELYATVVDAGELCRHDRIHPTWLVVSQDCELASAPTGHREPTIELRPVLSESPPAAWGIKSRLLRLDESGHYLDSDSSHLHVSPAVLTTLADRPRRDLADGRLSALKTWLGLRYRRPAVPEHLVGLARAIVRGAEKHRRAPLVDRVHEVLFQVVDGEEPYRYSIFAIIEDEADADDARAWLAEIVLEIPPEFGLGDQLEAYTKEQTSLALVERSWTASLSDITWRRAADPKGAG